jgi:hypothetical protein
MKIISKRNVTAFGLLLALLGSGIAAKGVIISEQDAAKLMPAIPSVRTYEEAVRNSPVFQSLIYQSRTAMWGLLLVAVGTAVQLGSL